MGGEGRRPAERSEPREGRGPLRSGRAIAQATEQPGSDEGGGLLWRSSTALDSPRISIVIPALNEEKLIGRILAAFPRDLCRAISAELIVSDGGSGDRTTVIAKEWVDLVVVHRERRRQTIAEGRNAGASVARGELLVFINADTLPQDPVAFLEELDRFVGHGELAGTYAAWACPVQIAPEERRLSDRLFHGFFNRYVRLLNLIGLGMGRGECQVVWTARFREVGGYEDHMAAGEDFDLYRRLAERGKIGYSEALRVYESPRRFRRFGYLRVLFEWTLNGLAVMILGRSISKEWEEIR